MTRIDYNANVNADGLRQTYGTGEGKVGKGGQYHEGGLHVSRVIVEWNKLPLIADGVDATGILDWNVRIPKSAFIHKGELQVMVDFTDTSAGANLSLGLCDADQMDVGSALTHTGVSATGLMTSAEGTLANLQMADQNGPIVLAGADIAAVTGTSPGGYLLCATIDTEEFLTGVAVLSVFWSAGVPQTSDT